jgi:putative aldouronate transport system permease protein
MLGYVFTGLITITCLVPFLLVISGSFTPESLIFREGYRLIPSGFSTEAYRTLFEAPEPLLRAYGVSITITVAGALFGLFITSMTGYVLQRKSFKYRNQFAFFFFFTTLFGGGLVPWFILISRYLNMSNTLWALLLPGMLSVFNIILMRTFFADIPVAISESAKVDGAGEFTIFLSIMLPIAKPALATIGLFLTVQYWNDWYLAMLFITDDGLFPLQYFLHRMMVSMEFASVISAHTGTPVRQLPTESIKLAMTVIATGPIILAYPFAQRYFIKGITIGAVKG